MVEKIPELHIKQVRTLQRKRNTCRGNKTQQSRDFLREQTTLNSRHSQWHLPNKIMQIGLISLKLTVLTVRNAHECHGSLNQWTVKLPSGLARFNFLIIHPSLVGAVEIRPEREERDFHISASNPKEESLGCYSCTCYKHLILKKTFPSMFQGMQ